MEPEIIGNRIKELINIEGITEKTLADSLEISLLELKKKLNGEKEFYISEIMKIKELFHLNLEIFTKLFFENDFKIEEVIVNLKK